MNINREVVLSSEKAKKTQKWQRKKGLILLVISPV
jgi:hypothetical protein